MRIIDAHAHLNLELYPRSLEEAASQREVGAEPLIAEMDRWGVDVVCLMGGAPFRWWNWQRLPHGGNEEVLAAMRSYPDRVVGYYIPDSYGEPATVRRQLREAVEDFGFRGIKIHSWLSAHHADADLLDVVFEFAHERELPLIFHSGTIPYSTPAQMFHVAKRYPGIKVILGHGGKTDLNADCLALAHYADNLYIESSGQPNKVFLERFIRDHGAERVLFGTDWLSPLGSKLPARLIEIEELDISAAEREDILGRNAARLFRLDDR
ncbi:MAG: amidohydrolase family protein [Trueperaceae bacterium]